MKNDDYFERFENILEMDMVGELVESEKEKLISELLEEIGGILESPVYFQKMDPEEKEDLLLIYSKIIRSLK